MEGHCPVLIAVVDVKVGSGFEKDAKGGDGPMMDGIGQEALGMATVLQQKPE